MGNICSQASNEYKEMQETYKEFFIFHWETFTETHFVKDPEGYVSRDTHYDAWLAYCKLNNLLNYRETFVILYNGRHHFNVWFRSQPSFQIHTNTLQGMRLVSFPTEPIQHPKAPEAPRFVLTR